jgi:hypothetical protein
MRILAKFIISPDALMVKKNYSPGRVTTRPEMILAIWILNSNDMPRLIAHPGNGKDEEKPNDNPNENQPVRPGSRRDYQDARKFYPLFSRMGKLHNFSDHPLDNRK